MTIHVITVGLTEVDPDHHGGWSGRGGCAGCRNDVAFYMNAVPLYGVKHHTLINSDATRDAILGALKKVAAEAVSGDKVLFQLSGHGTQRPGSDGDEIDGKDEYFIAWDGRIKDDEWGAIWPTFKEGVRIWMIADCCHSGTNFRDPEEQTPNRFGIPLPQDSAPDEGEDRDAPEDRGHPTKIDAELIHYGACRDYETTAGFKSGGRFTLALEKLWNNGDFDGSIMSLYRALREELKDHQGVTINFWGPGGLEVSDAFKNSRPFFHKD